MPTSARQIRLGAFLQATGHHVAAWLHPNSQARAGQSGLATSATRAGCG
jgi:N-acetyl-S-(2-succino)cysteine monooxygenase